MEEKVLIKSQQYDVKKLFKIFVLIGLCIGLICLIGCLSSDISNYNDWYGADHEHDEWCYKYEYRDDYWNDHWEDESLKEYEYKMDCGQVVYGNAFFYAVSGLFQYGFLYGLIPVAAFALIGGIIYYWLRSYELTVTDKKIYGTVAWGRRVDLPMDAVSAIGMGVFKSIAISTASGRINFAAIKNRDEIHKIVSDLLVERQNKEKVVSATTIKQEIPQSNADEIKKFKDLLDSGVITQEEFDAKKKQLLGL